MGLPRITIVTPSYNQGRFLADTIESVLGQNYPHLEYIVMDGGSTDDSVEVIKRYEKHLAHWVSAKDGGQAAAINAAFARSTGDILGWVNSDDYLLPGALRHAAGQLQKDRPQVLIGNCFHFTEGGGYSAGSSVPANHGKGNLELIDYVIQPAAMWTRRAWEAAGTIDDTLSFTFDWDWFIRAQRAGVEFSATDRYMAVYRLHAQHKTGTGGEVRFGEIARIYGRYAGGKYEAAFRRMRAKRSSICRCRSFLQRCRLKRWEMQLLSLLMPDTFGGLAPGEIALLCEMGGLG